MIKKNDLWSLKLLPIFATLLLCLHEANLLYHLMQLAHLNMKIAKFLPGANVKLLHNLGLWQSIQHAGILSPSTNKNDALFSSIT